MKSIDMRAALLTPLCGRAGLRVIVALSLAAATAPARAQMPLQDAKGKDGSVFLNQGGLAQINITDSSLRLGYAYRSPRTRPITRSHEYRSFVGFSVSGKPKNGRATLLKDDSIASDVQVKLSLGLVQLGGRPNETAQQPAGAVTRDQRGSECHDVGTPWDADAEQEYRGQFRDHDRASAREGQARHGHRCRPEGDEEKNAQNAPENSGAASGAAPQAGGETFSPYRVLALQVAYQRAQYSLYDPDAAFGDQVRRHTFDGGSLALVYNSKLTSRALLGLSAGAARMNNADTLTEVEVRDIITTPNDGTEREVVVTRKALRGDYQESTKAVIKGDLLWYPSWTKSRIAIDLWAHTDVATNDWRPRLGGTVFWTEKDDLTRVIGGISVSHGDVSLFAGALF